MNKTTFHTVLAAMLIAVGTNFSVANAKDDPLSSPLLSMDALPAGARSYTLVSNHALEIQPTERFLSGWQDARISQYVVYLKDGSPGVVLTNVAYRFDNAKNAKKALEEIVLGKFNDVTAAHARIKEKAGSLLENVRILSAKIENEDMLNKRMLLVRGTHVLEIFVDMMTSSEDAGNTLLTYAITELSKSNLKPVPTNELKPEQTHGFQQQREKSVQGGWLYSRPASNFTPAYSGGRWHTLAVWANLWNGNNQKFMGSSCGAYGIRGCISSWVWWGTQPWQRSDGSALGIESTWFANACSYTGNPMCGPAHTPSYYTADVYSYGGY